LYAIIVQAFSSLTADEIVKRLDAAQIGNARMNDMHEVWEHAQLRARERWVEVESPVGKIRAMLPPGMPDVFKARMDAIPAVGQHTDSILAEIGYDRPSIAKLRAEGVV
jgi:itaconate CoA-transferase